MNHLLDHQTFDFDSKAASDDEIGVHEVKENGREWIKRAKAAIYCGLSVSRLFEEFVLNRLLPVVVVTLKNRGGSSVGQSDLVGHLHGQP